MKHTLLVVDDNLANLAVLFDYLDSEEYHILAAGNGIDAVELAAQARPDLILLDVRMPGMNGYETCRAIKANPDIANTPILFLSALTDTDDRLMGFEAGGVDYITKPVNAADVLARIRTHITLATLQQVLITTNEQLEETVTAKTAELQAEIELRCQQQLEKEQLLRLLQEQNQQLYSFTSQLLQTRPMTQLELANIINQQLLDNLTAITTDLHLATQSLTAHSSTNRRSIDLLQTVWQRADQMQRYLHGIVVAPRSAENNPLNAESTALAGLSEREREVLSLLCNGDTTAQIGIQLSLSDVTIRTHRAHIMRKLNISHLPGLVKFALKHNLTSIHS
ncbi:MAG: response regulator [Candidatus Promineifilaceae bacterium]